MQLRTIAAFCALLAFVACFGCTTAERTPELLHVIDIVPREADVGDRMEIMGAGFPEGRPAKVVFEGMLFRPGQKPSKGFEIAVDAVSTSASRVELLVTESLRAAFCGTGDQAIHTTFEGNVLVSFPGATGMLPIQGSLRHVRLDFQPPLQRKTIVDARRREGERALELMGLGVALDGIASGGLLVTEVKTGSPADQAGIFPGDLITSFDGVRVFDQGDLVPGSVSRFASIGFVRGAASDLVATQTKGREVVRSISIRGFKPSAPSDLLGAGLLLLLPASGLLFFIGPFGRALGWVERRLASRMQAPRQARGLAFLKQTLRSLLRQDVLPQGSDEPLSRIAPYLVFLGISALFVVMPFGQHIVAADLDIGILFVVAVTLLVTMSLLSGGFSPSEKWSTRGGLYAALQVLGCEIPGAFAIACIVMMTGSLRVDEIVLAQGGFPWQWFVFKSPITFALFFLWMATSLFEGSRPSSEAAKATVAQPSSMRRLFFFFAEWGNVFVMCGLASVLFLGGWQLPGVSKLTQESSLLLQALGAAWFQIKSWGLVFVVVAARWMLPRARVDQMVRFCWRWLVPSTLVAFGATALWMQWGPPAAIEKLVTASTFTFCVGVVGYALARFWQRSRGVGAQAQLNPFL